MDERELRETFEHYDEDGNGLIDIDEFATMMEALEAGMSRQEIEIGFEFIDRDGNGLIDFDEFVSWWAEQ